MLQNLNACNDLVFIVVIDSPIDAKMFTAYILGCSLEQPFKEATLQDFLFKCIVNSNRDV